MKLANRIETWEIGRLRPYSRNARTHSADQVEKIAASIAEFGFTNPILVDSGAGIIAGHGRLAAAERLGLAEVPVIVLDHLTETQRRAYVLADNRLAELAGWDDALLAGELEALQADGFDLELLGWSDDELGALLDGEEPEEDGEGSASSSGAAVPEVRERAVTLRGDVWVLGDHRLMCGDSLAAADARRLMGNQAADLAVCSMGFTDPPWNVSYGDHPTKGAGRAILGDSQDAEQWPRFMAGFAGQLRDVTRAGAPVYVVMGSQEWPALDAALRQAEFHWSSTIVWVKDAFVLGRKDYHSQFEPIWYGWNSRAARLQPLEDRTQSDVWEFARPRVSELHPMTKPVELIERAVRNSSQRGAVVVDLFGGSGSTLIACENTGRAARLMELDPRYCDVIVRRWQDQTGRAATLASTGQTFDEAAAARAPANDDEPEDDRAIA